MTKPGPETPPALDPLLVEVLDAAPDGVALTDVDGTVLLWSRGLAEITGIEPSAAIQRALAEVIGRLIDPQQGDTGPFPYDTQQEVPIVRADGARLVVRVSPFRLRPEAGDLVGCFVRDITRRRRAEGQIRSLAMRLSLSHEQERRDIAVKVHDQLQQDLAALKLRMEILEQLPGPTDAEGELGTLSALVGRLTRRARRLSDEVSSPVLWNLGLMASLQAQLETLETNEGLLTRFYEEGGRRDLTREAEVVLDRSLRELLTNVTRHARATRVTVRVRWGDDQLALQVEDDGVGFAAQGGDLEDAPGGMGLFAVGEQLASLGGRLEVESAPGRGTSVALHTPCVPAAPGDGPAAHLPPSAGGGGVDAAERERQRLAAELHHGVLQTLGATRLQLDLWRRNDPVAPTADDLGDLAEALEHALDQARALTEETGSLVLHERGLDGALAALARRITTTQGLPVEWRGAGKAQVATEVAPFVYHGIRELLLNVARHAAATGAWIDAGCTGDEVWFEVGDDGVGTPPAVASVTPGAATGFGLRSLRQGARQRGGGLTIEPADDGRGTRARLVLPGRFSP